MGEDDLESEAMQRKIADLRKLSSEDRLKMVYYLRVKLPDTFKEELSFKIKQNPEKWYVDTDSGFMPFHFTHGMAIRNLLRSGGFGEKVIGIDNLDNVYVEVLEEAVCGT